MGNKKLLIEIDEKLYSDIKTIGINMGKIGYVLDAIKNGAVLPKGHSALVDENLFITLLVFSGSVDDMKCGEIKKMLEAARVIEADKEHQE